MAENKFFIMGNGGCGTSLLRGLLNAHSKIDCAFELYHKKSKPLMPNEEFVLWNNAATASKSTWWGNKIPLEIFNFWNDWKTHDILRIGREFHVIWIKRRYSRYKNSSVSYNKGADLDRLYKEGIAYENLFRDNFYGKMISLNFEDLLLRPQLELCRICFIMGLDFEKGMLNGTANTGYIKYNKQAGYFDLDKL